MEFGIMRQVLTSLAIARVSTCMSHGAKRQKLELRKRCCRAERDGKMSNAKNLVRRASRKQVDFKTSITTKTGFVTAVHWRCNTVILANGDHTRYKTQH